jgi:D-alanine-D-alanine ligase-like ATP-grasp enzyme
MWDWKHTIKELIEEKNTSVHRWRSCDIAILTKIKTNNVTDEYIKNRYAYILQTIPPKNKIVYLRGNSNLSTGWDAQDVTDIVHPKIKKICIQIAKICECPIIWIDIMIPRIDKDPDTQKRAVIEVNSNTAHNIHQTDIFWKPRNVVGAILDLYFKQ